MSNYSYLAIVPLAEIAPDWIDPRSGQSVTTLCERIACDGIVKIEPSKRALG